MRTSKWRGLAQEFGTGLSTLQAGRQKEKRGERPDPNVPRFRLWESSVSARYGWN